MSNNIKGNWVKFNFGTTMQGSMGLVEVTRVIQDKEEIIKRFITTKFRWMLF